MNWTRRLSLRTKLTALVAGLLALVSGVLLAVLPPRVNASSQLWAERRAEASALILSNAVAPGLDFDDASHVARQLEGIKRAPGSTYAGVRYSNGKLLASWQEKAIPAPVSDPANPPDKHLYQKNGLLHVEVAVITVTGQRGLLQVGFSMEELKEDRRNNMALIGMLAFGVFVAGAFAAFAIGTLLSQPLRQMTNVALRLAAGDITGAEGLLTSSVTSSGMGAGYDENSPDEVTGLAASFARMLAALRSTTVALQQSARTLTVSVERLSAANSEQGVGLKRQAESLSSAMTSAQELRVTSEAASSQANSVLDVAKSADEAGTLGESSIMESLSGLSEIREKVSEISRRVVELEDRISQAGTITSTVRELSDQSQMLALNASIEAARAGEQGRGFAVIAQQLRQLAQQSVDSTKEIQGILSELISETGQVVAFTEAGMGQVESSVGQMRASSERLRELTSMTRNSAEAVRSIATAVQQQDKGIDIIFASTNELSKMMDETMKRLMAVDEAMGGVDTVAKVVAQAAQTFRT